MLARVREMAATRCTGWGRSLLEFNGEADHVHLLVALPPNLDLSRFVNNLKTTNSRLLRKEFTDRLKAGLVRRIGHASRSDVPCQVLETSDTIIFSRVSRFTSVRVAPVRLRRLPSPQHSFGLVRTR